MKYAARSLLLAILGLGSSSAPASAQAIVPTRPAGARALPLFDEQGAEIWASAASYKAGFDAAGARFVPFLGSRAPRNFPIELALTDAFAGGVALELELGVAPRREGNAVVYERGSVVELYRIERDALEQLFRIDDPPRSGELVLRIRCDTELEPLADAGGIRFQGEHGGARYGKATVFDARGRSADAPVAWVDGSIEIRVAPDFLARAKAPITIDPLVTTLAIDTSPADDGAPDVAYDASLDVYALCWERRFSASDRDVHGRILDGAGNTVHEYLIDASPTILTSPRIAGIESLDRFLVATIRGATKGPVDGRIVDLQGGGISVVPPLTLLNVQCVSLDLGGDASTTEPHRFCVVAEEDLAGLDVVNIRLADQNGWTVGPWIELGGFDDESFRNPRVSRTLAGPADAQDAWAVFFEQGPSWIDKLVQIHVYRDGSWAQFFFTWTDDDTDFTAGAAQLMDAATGSRVVALVSERRSDPDPSQLHVRVASAASSGPETPIGPDSASSYEAAAIDGDGSSFVVAYTEHAPGGATTVHAASYVLEGLSLVLVERQQLSDASMEPTLPRIVSARSGGGAPGRFAAVWQDGPAPDGDIVGALYDTPGPGVRYCTAAPNSVGPGATIHASGSVSIDLDQFTLSAQGCPPNRPGIFYLGLSQVEIPFGEGFRCIGGATRRITPTLTTDASGAVSLLLDFDQPYGNLVQPGSPGTNYQFWYRDPAGGPSTFNLTDALHVEHTP